jgi:hypothetical protein
MDKIGSLFSNVINTYSNFLNNIDILLNKSFQLLYNFTPKGVGDVDKELIEDIDKGIDYLVVRIKSFNEFTRNLININIILSFLAVIAFIPGIILFMLATVFGFGQNQILITIVVTPAAFFILFAVGVIVLVDAYILLNLGLIVWFGFQKARQGLSIEGTSNRTDKYWCKISKGPKRYVFKKHEIYQKNLEAIYHLATYFSFSLLLWSSGRNLINIISVVDDLVSDFTFDFSIQVPYSDKLLNVTDSITPIDLETLLTLENMSILLQVLGILLFFAAFRYFNNIRQHSTFSGLDWSTIEPYSAEKEYNRTKTILKVANYQYRKQNNQKRFRLLFKELVKMVALLLISTALSGWYLNVFAL